MLHKKRTGKALHITKEIVEKEAMYEEVDERYQEKRLKLLKAHNSQLEAQFHRHLMVTMALGVNNARQPARISPNGSVQKMRHSIGSDPTSYFSNMHIQTPGAPISPNASSPTSPIVDMYSIPSSSSESPYVQTPASGCYMPTPMACPTYVDTGLVSPSVSPRTSTYQRFTPAQSAHMRSSSMAQPNQNTIPYMPRQRFASFPDAFMFQQPQMLTPIQTAVPYRDNSGSVDELSTTPSPHCAVPAMPPVQGNVLPSPDLSPPSMTSNSSQNSCVDNLSTLETQSVQGQIDEASFLKQPLLVASENPDPDYHEFFDFATNMEGQWQFPMTNAPFDDFVNLDGLDYELTESGL